MIQPSLQDKTFVRNLPPLEVYRRVVLGIILSGATDAREAMLDIEAKLSDSRIPLDDIVRMFRDKETGEAFIDSNNAGARFIVETIKRGLLFRRQQLITDAQRRTKARWN